MATVKQRDPYGALGVSQDASQDEIKRAYRKLAKQYHPDSTGGDAAKEKRFKEVSAAYEVLGDPKKRAQYDNMRSGGFQGGGGQAFDFGDLFSQFFGGGMGGPRQGGGGVHYRVYQDGPQSHGIPDDFSQFFSHGARPQPQPRPKAKKKPQKSERKVKAADGSTLVQKGHDVFSDVRLTLQQAVLGTVVEVPTLSGTAKVKIPPGTSSGVKLRLREKGVTKPGGKKGCHYVTVQIDVPKKLSKEAEKALEEFLSKL